MTTQFPEEQFNKTLPLLLIPGWKRAFMRTVAKMLILYDRTDEAEDNPTKKSIRRAVVMGINVGQDLQFYTKINPTLVRKKFPKDWEDLCLEECRRVYRGTENAD